MLLASRARNLLFVWCLPAILGMLFVPNQALANSKYASLVIDASNGVVVHQERANSRRYPASLTKLMTLYMTFQSLENGKLSLNKRLRVSSRAAGQPPSKIGLRRGEYVRVKDLIKAMVVKSANDAAVVVSEAIAGSEWQFAIKMTRVAKRLGMNKTRFKNASGLHHRKQITTASDMAKLAVALRRDFPQYYHYFKHTKFTYRGRTYRSHNRVVKNYRGADGLKTGYIRASGFNLITSAARGNQSIVAVVMGGRTAKRRDRHMKKLLDRGFYRLARGYKGSSKIKIAALVPPNPVLRPKSFADLKPSFDIKSLKKPGSKIKRVDGVPLPELKPRFGVSSVHKPIQKPGVNNGGLFRHIGHRWPSSSAASESDI